VKNFLFDLNADFPVKIPDLISLVYITSFVIIPSKYLKYFTFSICYLSTIISIWIGCLEILIVSPHLFLLQNFFQFHVQPSTLNEILFYFHSVIIIIIMFMKG